MLSSISKYHTTKLDSDDRLQKGSNAKQYCIKEYSTKDQSTKSLAELLDGGN